jgi:hypothetical protein
VPNTYSCTYHKCYCLYETSMEKFKWRNSNKLKDYLHSALAGGLLCNKAIEWIELNWTSIITKLINISMLYSEIDIHVYIYKYTSSLYIWIQTWYNFHIQYISWYIKYYKIEMVTWSICWYCALDWSSNIYNIILETSGYNLV